MKHLIAISIIICFLFSCSKREDYYLKKNTVPMLTLKTLAGTGSNSSILDSVKLGYTYTFKYFVKDDACKYSLSWNQILGIDGVTKSNDSVITIVPTKAGTSVIKFTASDIFHTSSSVNLTLFEFANLAPLAKVKVSQVTGGFSTTEISIDLSASIDQDAKWGGKVISYYYQIGNNYNTTSDLSSIRYICDSPGQKQITVKVQDDNGSWSEPVIEYFTVN